MEYINKLAPTIAQALSPEAEKAVAEFKQTGKLSPFATKDTAAIRRESEGKDLPSALRPAFIRDAEKIIHMPSYNRLSGKTQVFSFYANDDITRRGLHVQLVARVARDIGRALGLNLDLIEAIALGHDIGHTPFGHAGERLLHDIYNRRTTRHFYHNVQSVRVLDVLGGRNLSLQTLDGIICHNGEFEQQVFETSGLEEFDTFDRLVEGCWVTGEDAIGRLRPMTLEGCVVRVSDIIAYIGKDRQDAIRAGIASEDTFDDGLGGAYNSWALAVFIADVVEHSLGKSRIEMSEEAFSEMSRAKRENYEKIYRSEMVLEDFERMGVLFERLYSSIVDDLVAGREEAPVFRHHIRVVREWLSRYGRIYDWESDPDIVAVDYIQSMSDDYFVAICSHLFPEMSGLFPLRTHF